VDNPLPPWFGSPYDGQLHLLERLVGETAQAWCTHSAPLADTRAPADDETEPRCMACLLNWGENLAQRFGDADRYST
jgi:hypothetical protein